MKKMFRKNQLVITALALMIAVAGYFSYMNNNVEDEEIAAASTDADLIEEEYGDISEEELYVSDEIFTDEGTGEELALEDGTQETTETASGDTATASGDTLAAETDTDTALTGETTDEVENPGEAVLTSTTVTNLDYAAEMKLNREQLRSKNKETLLEIIDSTSVSDDLKQDAINKMIAMTDIAERETAAEMLLEAKGFSDVVVSITDDSCDVVLDMGEVTDAKRAQVEDIVKRKTNISADKIVITPIVVEEASDGE